MAAKRQEIEQSAREAIAKAGLDPDEVLAAKGTPPDQSFEGGANQMADEMAKARETLKRRTRACFLRKKRPN